MSKLLTMRIGDTRIVVRRVQGQEQRPGGRVPSADADA